MDTERTTLSDDEIETAIAGMPTAETADTDDTDVDADDADSDADADADDPS